MKVKIFLIDRYENPQENVWTCLLKWELQNTQKLRTLTNVQRTRSGTLKVSIEGAGTFGENANGESLLKTIRTVWRLQKKLDRLGGSPLITRLEEMEETHTKKEKSG